MVGWKRLASQMAVDKLQGVTISERELAGKQFIKGDPKRVKVGSIIQDSIHPAGLFRRHVDQGPFQESGVTKAGVLLGKRGGNTKVDEFDLTGVRVEDDIRGIDILVDNTLLVNLV
jgi:hypothetical protein